MTYITTLMGQKLYAEVEPWMADFLNEYIQEIIHHVSISPEIRKRLEQTGYKTVISRQEMEKL